MHVDVGGDELIFCQSLAEARDVARQRSRELQVRVNVVAPWGVVDHFENGESVE